MERLPVIPLSWASSLVEILRTATIILSLLEDLPMILLVEPEEVLSFIENHDLMGKGLGYIDVHLLASTVLSGLPLWTLDKKLERVAAMLRRGI
jgi:predicted nucleic acid-binding protein